MPATYCRGQPRLPVAGIRSSSVLPRGRKYGIECHVWKVNFNMGWSSPKEFMERMKARAARRSVFDGRAEERWLCPSHPANKQLED